MHQQKFIWDKAKNQKNLLKHAIDFDLASEIFLQDHVKFRDDRHDYGEERFIALGKLEEGDLLSVVYTERKGKIRIISARRAHRKERKIYEARSKEND